MLCPLVIEFQTDHNVANIEDQFMCGRNLLIAPIVTKNNTRSIYLPEGTWYDYWTGEQLTGRCWITRTCSLEFIPVFVRTGSILPLGPEVQCTDELADDWLLLKIYPDANGEASYEILDKERRVQIDAVLEDGSLKVAIDPRPSYVGVELPKGITASTLLLNGEPTN